MHLGDAEHDAASRRARQSLSGLSIGDALGAEFYREILHSSIEEVVGQIENEDVPVAPWRYTDDTEMALSIVQTLEEHHGIDQDALAAHFARNFDPRRGYGSQAVHLLAALRGGGAWRDLAPRIHGGQGSCGNGSCMRVAPLGAYFANDLDAVTEHARRSAVVTHAHPEGTAGAIAVAVASAAAWQTRSGRSGRESFFDLVLRYTPAGATRDGIERARDLPPSTRPEIAAERLGSGQEIKAQDTVPFSLWCAARHLDDYASAIFAALKGLGDIDTTAAIAGGIVVMSDPEIPTYWRTAREPLPGFADC